MSDRLHDLVSQRRVPARAELVAEGSGGRVDIRPIQGGTSGEWIDVPEEMLFELEACR